MEVKSSAYPLSSVKNALRLLNSFSTDEPEKRVCDLASELGIGKSTVSRLLSTLASEGYVIKDTETQKYRLGLRILTLCNIVSQHIEINREARPILKNLVRETSEAAHIAVLEGDQVVYIEQLECSHPVRILSYVGRRNPIYCTSSGRVLLAFQEDSKILSVLGSNLIKITPYTITDPTILMKQLQQIKEQEYCTSVNEYIEGIISFSAPIRDYSRRVIAAVTLVGPIQRIQEHQIPRYSTKVLKAAREISRNLGYPR